MKRMKVYFTKWYKKLRLLLIWQIGNFISDSGMESLFQVMRRIIEVMNDYLQFSMLQNIIDVFPSTLCKARRIVGIDRDDFDKYIVCSNCDEIYEYNAAFELKFGTY